MKRTCPCGSLASKHPDLLAEWIPELNQFDPHELLPGSNEIAWWKCRYCGHQYERSIWDRTRTDRESRCPKCESDGKESDDPKRFVLKDMNEYTKGQLKSILRENNQTNWSQKSKPELYALVGQLYDRLNLKKLQEEVKDMNEERKSGKDEVKYADEPTEICRYEPSEDKNIIYCRLRLNDGAELDIPARAKDAFVNATAICKASGKRFNNWYRSEQTQELISALEAKTRISALALIEVRKGGNDKTLRGSWIHPDLAIHLAMWASPGFAIQVSHWTRELLLIGKVELGQEKDSDDLELSWKEKAATLEQSFGSQIAQLRVSNTELTEEVQELRKFKSSHERTHRYVKFDLTQSAYYAFTYGKLAEGSRLSKMVKCGIASKSKPQPVNSRISCHRTTYPCLKIEFIIGAPHIYLLQLESFMKLKFGYALNPSNHEVFDSVPPATLKHAAITTFELLCPGQYTVVDQGQIDAYNEDAETTFRTEIPT